MTRQAMREKVLGEMVVARDIEIIRINALLAASERLNRQQGDKVLELLEENAQIMDVIETIGGC